jgi:hypothetical protein
MEFEQELCERIDALLRKGDQVLSTHKPNPPNVIAFSTLDHGTFVEWQTQCLSFLNGLLPKDHTYVEQFRSEVKIGFRSSVEAGLGVLRALREDIVGGYLRRFATFIQADVFTDFLEMAQHLLESGYKDAAALLSSAVLEQGLRRITMTRGITVRSKDDMGSLNQRCADAGIYNRLMQKKVQVWNDIRNNAAHGHFDQYTEEDVTAMLSGVRDFLASHL